MGKIHAKWKEAKGAMSKETVEALPKADFGGQLDAYEALSEKIQKNATQLATDLEEWYKTYVFVQQTTFPAYIKKVGPKEKAAHDIIADMLRLIRGVGAKTHGEWDKLKSARIGTLKF